MSSRERRAAGIVLATLLLLLVLILMDVNVLVQRALARRDAVRTAQ